MWKTAGGVGTVQLARWLSFTTKCCHGMWLHRKLQRLRQQQGAWHHLCRHGDAPHFFNFALLAINREMLQGWMVSWPPHQATKAPHLGPSLSHMSKLFWLLHDQAGSWLILRLGGPKVSTLVCKWCFKSPWARYLTPTCSTTLVGWPCTPTRGQEENF